MAVILVVDDNQKIRRLIDIYLRREGFSTLLAETGEQALHLLGEQAVDLMIVDIMMPGMDGYALVRQLRENRMEIPVLMATAKTEFADKKEGFEAGADDYMTKPVDLEELVLRVRALLRRSRIYSENQIRIGEVTLDYNTLEVRLPGETVVLPQKEFYLLYKLFSYPNRIFTRQELMDEIWGFDSETSPRTVDVHIKRLRERFEQVPDLEISTIRGLGYKGVQKGYMKKRCKRRSTVYHQVVGLLCLIMLVTTAVPTVMFSHFSRRAFAGDVQNQVLSSIDTVADYLEQHHLPLSDIDELLSFERLRLRILDDLSPLELDKEEQRRLAADGYLVFSRTSGNGLPHAMLNRYKDSYILVQADMEPIFRLSRQTKLLSLLLTLLIGLIAAMIGGYRLLVPVRMLDEATRKVAAGDFTVRIPAPKRMDEIGSLIESFNTMTRELGSVEMLRSNFVSDISHEFKTPLTAIEGYAKLLEGDCSPEERREYVGTITDETRRLSVLVANILMINRLDKGNIPSERHPVRIDEQIRHALALCEAGWTGKNLELDLELDEIYFAGYESLLMQVWANLIDNAVKFSPDGGRISLALHQKGGRVVFVICNDGDNIPEESRPHLFEQFYKADPSRGGEGNGLGLSIVKRVAELHGGEASVENLPGSGVRFTIFL